MQSSSFFSIVCGEYINPPPPESMRATAFRLRNVTEECDISHILVHPVVMWWESGAALPAITVQAHGWVSATEFLFRSLLASNPSQFNLNVCM